MNGTQENLKFESVLNVIVHGGIKKRKTKDTHRCCWCKQDKPRNKFRKHRGEGGFRLNSRCIDCNAEYQRSLHRKRDFSNYDQKKIKVRVMTRKQIKKGFITPRPCEICGAKGQVHHPDYSKPFDIVWLCVKHHGEKHRIYTYP